MLTYLIMDALHELVNILDSQDKIAFKSYLSRKNKRNDVKNIKLFNLIETDDIKSLDKIYKNSKNKDAYHALRKRLLDSLLLFLSQRTFENSNDEIYDILRNIVVARFLLENNLSKIGFKSLDKAERMAINQEQFSLVNEILLLKLQFSHLDPKIDLEKLTGMFRINQDHMQREAKLRLAYASLRKELNEIHLKGKVVNLSELIETTIKKYQINRIDFMNYKSLYQILFIANEYAAINQNYSLIQRFLIKSHRFIESQKEKPDSQIFYKLHVLYYLANFSLRNKAFAESIDYLMQMEVLFDNKQQYKSVLYARQQLLFALNYFYIGNPEKGLGYVEDALADLPKHGSQTDIEDLMLTKAMFLTQLNDDESLSIMAKLTHTDAWYEKKLGMLWSIRKNLMEILMQIQFGNVELSLSRIKSFKRRYKKYLNQVNEQRVLNFVALVEKFLAKPDVIYQQTFQSTVYKMLEIEENRDIFNISFIAWLVSRWEKTIPYKITIRIIQGLSEVSPTKMT